MNQAAIVVKPVVQVYVSPKLETEVSSQAIYGNRVIILKEEGSWVYVEVSPGEEGWVEKNALRTWQETKELRFPIQRLFAHIYRTPDTIAAPPLMTLPFGAPVAALDPNGRDRWIPIRLEEGRDAWIQRGDLDFAPRTKSLEEAIAQGLLFIGLPYTWGGISSFGFDCSGLVRLLFRLMGHSLPRNSYEQAAVDWLLPVDPAQIQRGDLLFFGEEKVSHAALSLGNGEFLHSGVRDGFHGVGVSRLGATNYCFKQANRLPA